MPASRCPLSTNSYPGNGEQRNANCERANVRVLETSASSKRDQTPRPATVLSTPSSKRVSTASGLARKSCLPVGGNLRPPGSRPTFKKQAGLQSKRHETMCEGDLSQAIRNPNQSRQVPSALSSTTEGSRVNVKCTRKESVGQRIKRSSAPLVDTKPIDTTEDCAETISALARVHTDHRKRRSRKVRSIERGRAIYTSSCSENHSSSEDQEELTAAAKLGQEGPRPTFSKSTEESNEHRRHPCPARKSSSGLPLPLCSRSKNMTGSLLEPHKLSNPNASHGNPQIENAHSTSHDHTSKHQRIDGDAANPTSSSSARLNSSSSTSALHSVAVTPISAISSLPVRPPTKAHFQQSDDTLRTREQNMAQGKDLANACENEPTLPESVQKTLTSNRHASQTLLRLPKSTFKASLPISDINTGSSNGSRSNAKSCIMVPTSTARNRPPMQIEVATVSNSSINTSLKKTIKEHRSTGLQRLRELAKADTIPQTELTSPLKQTGMSASLVAKRDSGAFLNSSSSCVTVAANTHPVCKAGKEEYLVSFREKSMDPPSSPLPLPKISGVATTESEPRGRRHTERKLLSTLLPSKLPMLFGRSNPKVVSLSGRASENHTSSTNRNRVNEVTERRTRQDDRGAGDAESRSSSAEISLADHWDPKDEDKEILRCTHSPDGSCIRPTIGLMNGKEGDICVEDNRHHSFPPLSNPNTPSPAPGSGYGVQKDVRYRRKELEDGSHEMEAGRGKLASRMKRCTEEVEEEQGGSHPVARCCIIL